MQNVDDKKFGLIAFTSIVVFLLIVLYFTGSFGGYKVKVNGQVCYDMINGWSVTYRGNEVSEDNLFSFSIFSDFGWYMPWETKDVIVELEMVGAAHTVSRINLGTMSSLFGCKDFEVTAHHLPSGYYEANLKVYEAEKSWFGLITKKEMLRDTVGFTVTVGDVSE